MPLVCVIGMFVYVHVMLFLLYVSVHSVVGLPPVAARLARLARVARSPRPSAFWAVSAVESVAWPSLRRPLQQSNDKLAQRLSGSSSHRLIGSARAARPKLSCCVGRPVARWGADGRGPVGTRTPLN